MMMFCLGVVRQLDILIAGLDEDCQSEMTW